MVKTKIAVFASGTGSNYDAIMQAIERNELQADVALVVSDQPKAKVIEKAKSYGTKTFVFNPKDYPSKAAFEHAILDALRKAQVEWIILAGYMRLIGKTLLNEYEGKIINIHPSLLPAFPGLDAIGQAFQAGVKVTGVTIHYVDEGMDTGTIIAQQPVMIESRMSNEDLQVAIQKVEHHLYPKTIQQLIN